MIDTLLNLPLGYSITESIIKQSMEWLIQDPVMR